MKKFDGTNPEIAQTPLAHLPSSKTPRAEMALLPLVFLGPSLPQDEAGRWLRAEFWPPIVRGDLVRAVQEGYRWIGIVDGAFHQTLTVSLQEIHWALRQGAKLYGSSSMGALRAVETRTLGMVGIGKVYEWFLTEKIDADDEVAICFDTKTGRALSEPLVNIRATLEKAELSGMIDPALGKFIFQEAENLHFSERSYPMLLKKLQGSLSKAQLETLKEYLDRQAVDLKGEDAIELLRRMKADHDAALRSATTAR